MNRHLTPAPRNAKLPPSEPPEPADPRAAALDALIAAHRAGRFGAGFLAAQAYLLGYEHARAEMTAEIAESGL